jgi:signal transduction histidine kinase
MSPDMSLSAFRPFATASIRTASTLVPASPPVACGPACASASLREANAVGVCAPVRARPGIALRVVVILAAVAGILLLALPAMPGSTWSAWLLRAACLLALCYAMVRWSRFEAEQHERAKLLAKTAAAAERKRISLDLHDGAIQPYLGLKLGLEALRRKVSPGDALASDIDELYRMTQDSIMELRGYVRALDGRMCERTALADGLQRQVERFRCFYGLTIDLHLPPDLDVASGLSAELVQMVGEGLSNVGRHTASRQVSVIVARADAQLVVDVVNHGGAEAGAWRPFTPGSLTRRADYLNGCVQVMPEGTGGSIVRIAIPL